MITMKILAVIPARAGSRGIPNKNLRIVGGHPLVYYALQNAKASQYITDVLVSTDSTEVEIIAKQLGVATKWRSAELCGDSVTLDAVVYDASKDGAWDYIVTMQPTSPTLRVETLDAAIRYTIEQNLDTVISAINAPRLSWGEKDGKKVPNYAERLNRQYLPAQYMETGAFVVARASVVTPKTRIGQRVEVYEVSEDEAVDVDTFYDLRCVSEILKGERVAFYVNGNNTRGTGHVYRALELADEFYSKPDIYYDINQTDPAIFGKTTHALIGVNGIEELFRHTREKQYHLFINDILTTSIDYMIALRETLPNAKIVNFEDDGEGIYKADLVINALYEADDAPNVRAGEQYYIASKLFMFYNPIAIREKVERVFISFGGADPQNYTDRMLALITREAYRDMQFTVVLGRAKSNVDELMKYNDFPNIEVLYDVRNMPELMSACDVGVTSRGRTGYELATLGIPSMVMAQNAREEKHGFVSDANGFLYLGLNPSDHVVAATLDMLIAMPPEDRARYQRTLLSHDLRAGRKRVMALINAL